MTLMRRFCECYRLKAGVVIIGIINILVSGGLICSYLFKLQGQINVFRRLAMYSVGELDLLKLNMDIAIWVHAADILFIIFMMIPPSFTDSATTLKTSRCVRTILIPSIIERVLSVLHGLTAIVWLLLVFGIRCSEIYGIMIAIGLHVLLGMYLIVIAISYYQELGEAKRNRNATLKHYTRQPMHDEPMLGSETRLSRLGQREAMTDDEFESIMSEASHLQGGKDRKKQMDRPTHSQRDETDRKYERKLTSDEEHQEVSKDRYVDDNYDTEKKRRKEKLEMEKRREKLEMEKRREKLEMDKRNSEQEYLGPRRISEDETDNAYIQRHGEPRLYNESQRTDSQRGWPDEGDIKPPKKLHEKPKQNKRSAKMRYAPQYRNDMEYEDEPAEDHERHPSVPYDHQHSEEYNVFTDV